MIRSILIIMIIIVNNTIMQYTCIILVLDLRSNHISIYRTFRPAFHSSVVRFRVRIRVSVREVSLNIQYARYIPYVRSASGSGYGSAPIRFEIDFSRTLRVRGKNYVAREQEIEGISAINCTFYCFRTSRLSL